MATQLDHLERLRQNLEVNIAELRKSLQYWQTWEYEYEGLKEELERLDEGPTSDEMLAIGTDLGLDIADEKEIKSLLHYGKQPARTRSQVIAQIRGRIDTGHKNASTMQKQLTAAEEKLEKVLMVAEPVMESEGGEQLMDIFEELDDDDNVISSRVVDASKDRAKIHDVLRNNGLAEETKLEEDLPANQAIESEQKGMRLNGKTTKVAFAQESEAPCAPAPNKMHPTQRMLILDKDDNVIDSKPLELVHHVAQSQDDEIAHLREASSNAQEIAPIVASFDIEPESDSDVDTDMEDVDDDDSENEYGMGDIGTELTDDYKAQMEALMQKHAVAMENAGPNFDPDVIHKLKTAHRDAGLVAKSGTAEQEHVARKSAGKGVRFSEALDISPEHGISKPKATKDTPEMKREQVANPVSEAVMERRPGATTADTKASSARKPSRFKTTMNTTANRLPDLDDQGPSNYLAASIPQVISRDETLLPERPKKVSQFKAAKMG